MTDKPDAALKYVDALKNLAEGRFDLKGWLDWWNEHNVELQWAMFPGWSLRLEPTGDPSQTLVVAQRGACHILDELSVEYHKSDRYQQEWQRYFAQFRADQAAKKKAAVRQYEPGIKMISKYFPKFARFLKKRATDIEALESPITSEQLADLERSLGVSLPSSYKQFLLSTRSLRIEYLDFSVLHPFLHSSPKGITLPTEGMVCIADYWLDADGDQVLFDVKNGGEDDPPVFYYAHEAPSEKVRQIAPTFAKWIESLSKSPMFE